MTPEIGQLLGIGILPEHGRLRPVQCRLHEPSVADHERLAADSDPSEVEELLEREVTGHKSRRRSNAGP